MFVQLQAGVKLTWGPELMVPACIAVGHALDLHRTVLSVFVFRRCFPHLLSFACVAERRNAFFLHTSCQGEAVSATKQVPACCDVKSFDWGKT